MTKRIDNEEDMRKLRDLIFNGKPMNLNELSKSTKIQITEDPDTTAITSRSKSKRTEQDKIKNISRPEISCGCQFLICYYGGCLAYTFFLAVAPNLQVIVDRQTALNMILADAFLWVIPIMFAAGAADNQSHGG